MNKLQSALGMIVANFTWATPSVPSYLRSDEGII